MVERSLSMREAPGSIPGLSTFFFNFKSFYPKPVGRPRSTLGPTTFHVPPPCGMNPSSLSSRALCRADLKLRFLLYNVSDAGSGDLV
jgi:hypothetical protein